MHKTRLGHAALASDLIEDLRAPIVDKTVLDFVNTGEIGVEDFELKESGAVYMKRDAMRRLTKRLSEVIVKGQTFFAVYGDMKSYGFQVMLDKKISSLIRAIDRGDATLYMPYIWEVEK